MAVGEATPVADLAAAVRRAGFGARVIDEPEDAKAEVKITLHGIGEFGF